MYHKFFNLFFFFLVVVVRHMKVHDQVVMGCEWHPHEPSKVATCSWDGTIKFWD